MSKSYKIIWVGLLIFGLITWTTMSLNYDTDSADKYGFPFNFYTKVSGYNVITNEGGTVTEFNYLALLGDTAFALAFSWLLFMLVDKFNKRTKNI